MSKMIAWEHYMIDQADTSVNPFAATDDQIAKVESKVGYKLPPSLIQLLKQHAGMTPTNLVPIYPNGKKMSLDFLAHTDFENREAAGYHIAFLTTALADEGYKDLLAFSAKGNVFLCLDYGVRESDPPVVMLIREGVPEDPTLKHRLAYNFDEFLKKYTV